MKLLTTSESSLSNSLQSPDNGNFDHENGYRKPPVILKIVPEAGYDVYTGKRPISEKQRRKSNNDNE
jgi:hypothetical protein